MKKYSILLLVVLLCSCVAHKNSYQNQNSKVTVEFSVQKKDSTEQDKADKNKIVELAVKQLVSFGINKIGDWLNKEKDKYSATYNTVKQIEYYNHNNNRITIKRKIDKIVKKDTVKDAVAMEFLLDIEKHENYMKLVPYSLKLNYPKAKITEKSCFCDPQKTSKVLINFNIKLLAAWQDKNGEKRVEELTDTDFSFVQKLSYNTEQETILNKALDKVVSSDMIKPIPYSSSGGTTLLVKIKVDEIDGCENEVVKIANIFEKNKSDIVDGIMDLKKVKNE
ncbi:hypothetical protein [Wenyingzhuangia sp. IMCC45574]